MLGLLDLHYHADAGGVASALKLGIEPCVDNVLGELRADDARAEAYHVRVIMLL